MIISLLVVVLSRKTKAKSFWIRENAVLEQEKVNKIRSGAEHTLPVGGNVQPRRAQLLVLSLQGGGSCMKFPVGTEGESGL